MAVRVLIVEGHAAVGRGLAALLAGTPELEVVGPVDCPVRGLWQAVRTPPDVALVDAELPGLCSAAFIRLLRARSPKTRVVALGVYPTRRTVALGAGADTFLLKDAGYQAFAAAIGGDYQRNNPGARSVRSEAVPVAPRADGPAGVAEEL